MAQVSYNCSESLSSYHDFYVTANRIQVLACLLWLNRATSNASSSEQDNNTMMHEGVRLSSWSLWDFKHLSSLLQVSCSVSLPSLRTFRTLCCIARLTDSNHVQR